jgi:hypothetical protein
MKQLNILLFALTATIGLSLNVYAQTYTVTITVNDCWWSAHDAYTGEFTANLFQNGNPIASNSNYYYYWYFYSTQYNEWRLRSSGPGPTGNHATCDENEIWTLQARVTVTDTIYRTFIDIQSAPAPEPAFSMPNQGATNASFVAYRDNGGSITDSYVTPNHWRYSIGQWKNGFKNWLTVNYTETLQSTPQYVLSLGEKMDYWNNDHTSILNYGGFYISGITTESAYYKVTDGTTTITTSVIDGGGLSGGTVSFQDPWLVDNTDQQFYTDPYGYHNLGMNAPFKQENAPLNLSTGSKYFGVFLNRNYGGSTPYYSVSAQMVQSINGQVAFFAGWTCSPANSVDFQNVGSTTTAVKIKNSNATITAQYKYYTVTYNSTIPSASWTAAGTVTVPSGVTLTVSSGATVSFPSGNGLTVNGALSASGATFTSSGIWNGITINANGSSLSNCTISSASCPIAFYNVSSATVSGGTINNSAFSSSQAILISGSTPTIQEVTITGNGSSSNGVRYTNGSGGTLNSCTIQNLGAGNGITIQGNCSATISGNTVSYNYYDGYMITGPTTSNPSLLSNTFDHNGIVNGTRYYNGVVVYNYAAGLITGNSVQYSNWGITAYVHSSPTAGGIGQVGGNTVTNNLYGVLAYDNSYPNFGGGDPYYDEYWGTCNNIYGNATVDVAAISNSGVSARYNWWGQNPPSSSQFSYDGSSYVDYTYYLTNSDDCPLNNYKMVSKGPLASNKISSDNPASLMQFALDAVGARDYAGAAALYRLVLKDTTALSYHEEALSRLYSVFQASHDTTIIEMFASLKSSSKNLGESATELLAASLAGSGRLSQAQRVAEELRTGYPGTETEKKALMLLTSLRSFDKSYSSVSKAAFGELVNKFGTTLDRAWLVGVRTADDVALPAETGPSVTSSTKVDSSEVTLASYPNPFNPSTRIQFTVRQAAFVSLKVYDMLGREVATLVSETKNIGVYSVNWNASQLASGIYFARFETAGKVAIHKLLYLK